MQLWNAIMTLKGACTQAKCCACCHSSRVCEEGFSLEPGLSICADHEEVLELIVSFGLLNAFLMLKHKS